MTLPDLFYPFSVFVLAAFILLAVPRKALRILMPYAFVFGGAFEAVYVWIFQNLLGIIRFQHLGVFESGGRPFLSTLAWVLVIILYLYFWPQESRYLGYAYILSWAGLATAFSQLVKHAGLFHYRDWFYPIPMFISYLIWFGAAAWFAKPWHSHF